VLTKGASFNAIHPACETTGGGPSCGEQVPTRPSADWSKVTRLRKELEALCAACSIEREQSSQQRDPFMNWKE
jgi:hypothetical protein